MKRGTVDSCQLTVVSCQLSVVQEVNPRNRRQNCQKACTFCRLWTSKAGFLETNTARLRLYNRQPTKQTYLSKQQGRGYGLCPPLKTCGEYSTGQIEKPAKFFPRRTQRSTKFFSSCAFVFFVPFVDPNLRTLRGSPCYNPLSLP